MIVFKFRAWHKTTKRMATIDMLDFMLDAYRAHVGQFSGSGHLTDIELMQFTGLKDKNGKEVYEGDIVKAAFRPAFVMPNAPNPQNAVVEYDEDALLTPFHITCGYDGELWEDVLVNGFEIIGNIYEHPELVK